MGSNQFQKEYIEFLEKKNKELLTQLTSLRENYDNKIFSKDISKYYLVQILEELMILNIQLLNAFFVDSKYVSCGTKFVHRDMWNQKRKGEHMQFSLNIYNDALLNILNLLQEQISYTKQNVCLVLPQEIDLFFDKITSAMQAMKNVLMKKSELVQTVNKISKIISNAKSNTNFPINHELNLVNGSKLEFNGGNIGKVLPMIDGHIISTEPRVCLSRADNLTPSKKDNPIELSPIVEVSPEANLDNSEIERLCLKEIKISLERINLKNLSQSFANKENTPSRLSSLGSAKENEQLAKVSRVSTNDDPLEGTSSMHCENNQSQLSSFEKFNCFVDFKRRKHRFATMLNSDDRSSELDLLPQSEKSQSQEQSLLQNKSSCLRANTDSGTNSAKYSRMTINTSQDFIDESINEQEKNRKKKHELSEKRTNTPKEENNFENFKRDIKKNTSTPSGVQTRISPRNLYKRDENPSTDKSDRNSSSKINSYTSFEGSSKSNDNSKTLTPGSRDLESRLSSSRKYKKSAILKLKKQKSKSKKKLSSCKSLIKAESTLSTKNFTEISQGDLLSMESGSFESTSENGCRRAKRKAAPTNLKEPRLITKLRRE